jgi:diguanylate cyclase (GGDEF)-like protein
VGGEEFMVVAPETESDGAWTLAERMRLTVEGGQTTFNGSAIRMTISVGMVVAPPGVTLGYDALRHAAAAALAEAKSAGRNCSVLRVMPAAEQTVVSAES